MDTGITWRPVESSNVAAIGWPRYKDQLVVDAQVAHKDGQVWEPRLTLVMFKDGRVYGYIGSSRQRAVYIATRCLSPGRYVNRVLKNFTTVRIPELDVTDVPF